MIKKMVVKWRESIPVGSNSLLFATAVKDRYYTEILYNCYFSGGVLYGYVNKWVVRSIGCDDIICIY